MTHPPSTSSGHVTLTLPSKGREQEMNACAARKCYGEIRINASDALNRSVRCSADWRAARLAGLDQQLADERGRGMTMGITLRWWGGRGGGEMAIDYQSG